MSTLSLLASVQKLATEGSRPVAVCRFALVASGCQGGTADR